MAGKDSNYVPGWDCHGLPIEWKIEEEYRAKGKNKDEVPIIEFRRQCRAFAAHWVDVQREEFKRLGVIGDWDHPYETMSFPAEAQIAREIMKFAENGTLYRGSKPVMWSVVEKTALAEAEVEYEDHVSDTVWVAFPVKSVGNVRVVGEGMSVAQKRTLLEETKIVIWTTTPWTHSGQSRDQLFAQDRLWPLSRHRRAGEQLGQGRCDLSPRRRTCRQRFQSREGRGLREGRAGLRRGACRA